MDEVKFDFMARWDQAAAVAQLVVRVRTPQGSGTGFLIHQHWANRHVIVTAEHVVGHADAWGEPIKIDYMGKSVTLSPEQRGVMSDVDSDLAMVGFTADEFVFPEELMKINEPDISYTAGSELSWLGYPTVSPSTLCYFHGYISAYLKEEGAYLVDGVAINGVSGGPAFTFQDGKIVLLGMVTAYIPNLRPSGDSLTRLGLCEASGKNRKVPSLAQRP